MSSMPTVAAVKGLRTTAARHRCLELEIAELEMKLRATEERLSEARGEIKEAEMSVCEQLRAMDCTATGNGGWEFRISRMLGEFERQAREQE